MLLESGSERVTAFGEGITLTRMCYERILPCSHQSICPFNKQRLKRGKPLTRYRRYAQPCVGVAMTNVRLGLDNNRARRNVCLAIIRAKKKDDQIRFIRTLAGTADTFSFNGAGGIAKARRINERCGNTTEIEMHLDKVARGAGFG
ncbi:hypothetical protein SmB9_07980 [Sphingosinicella microcystinivorans]|uniref:Uncharacterized protein n=1 Tax=Sphingosinicella microcystinivorans TaxID=335406 RepID=A0AAD1D3S9_SPHMI|nr:hypothetical protein SmB9_07980 [Sphingosinicella microcystinivorans]